MNEYPYRKGVNAVVIDKDNNFLIVQKNSYGDNQWDFPGGGLDEGELPDKGILRELSEELGSSSFEIIKVSPIRLKFEWPQEAIDLAFKKHGKIWRGQEKFQFIVRFTGINSDLKIQEEELRRIKWVKYSELQDHLIFEGQWDNAKLVIEEAGLDLNY
jgi:putative (di)nucleoside polyphosphate hydrolase